MSSRLIFQEIPTIQEIQKKIQPTFLQEFSEYLFYFLKVFIVVAFVYIFIRTSIFEIIVVRGSSMFPTYSNEDVIYIDLITPKFSEYRRGEVVVVKAPTETSSSTETAKKTLFIKRVVGVPGDTIVLDDGNVFIYNAQFSEGIKLDESSYLNETIRTCKGIRICDKNQYDKKILGADEYYIMGDNRMNSTDSRYFGIMKKSEIIGREFFRLLPPEKSGGFKIPKYNIPN